MRTYKAKYFLSMFFCLFISATLSSAQEKIKINFDNKASIKDWEFIDEAPKNLGDAGPSTWEIKKGPLDGNSLFQGSNIWGSKADTCLMGTFAIYKAEKFKDFTIEMDVFAADNDGMGITWAYESTKKHYRVIMINDGWPEVPVDKIKGPFMKIQKRVSDDKPWYELIEAEKGITYKEQAPLHWKFEVKGGEFKLTREDNKTITGADKEYEEGYIGIQLYAQQGHFDNIVIENTWAVDPRKKVSTTWAQIKKDHN